MDFRYLQVSKIKEPTTIDICHIIFSEENVTDILSVGKPQMSILDTSQESTQCLLWYHQLHSNNKLFLEDN